MGGNKQTKKKDKGNGPGVCALACGERLDQASLLPAPCADAEVERSEQLKPPLRDPIPGYTCKVAQRKGLNLLTSISNQSGGRSYSLSPGSPPTPRTPGPAGARGAAGKGAQSGPFETLPVWSYVFYSPNQPIPLDQRDVSDLKPTRPTPCALEGAVGPLGGHACRSGGVRSGNQTGIKPPLPSGLVTWSRLS